MKKMFIWLLLVLGLGCNKDKIIRNQAEDLIMAAIVNGQWTVTGFHKGIMNVTSEFAPYKFQFKSNYTVDAINAGYVERTGTWNAQGDENAQTMTANFPGAPGPLSYLNGDWDIITTTWTSVNARKITNGETWTLRLDKL
jgi:hypothetical protein